jgi:hypothetical protein
MIYFKLANLTMFLLNTVTLIKSESTTRVKFAPESLVSQMSLSWSRNSSPFISAEQSFSCSYGFASGSDSDPDGFSPHAHSLFL